MPYSPGSTVLPKIHVLVLAPQGLLCGALMTFLWSLPHVRMAAEAHNLDELIAMLESNEQAEVLLLDADLLGAGLSSVIARLHAAYPRVNQIVLANGPVQQQAALQAGAGRALLKGFLGDELHQALS